MTPAESFATDYPNSLLEGGGGLTAIAFVRRPGRNPAVEVSGTAGQTMNADVPQEVWAQVQEVGRNAHLALEPSPDEQDAVCMEGGAVLAEVGLPLDYRPSQPIIRRRAVSACSLSPTQAFARRLEALAVPLFPGCAAIRPDWGSSVHRLYYCFRLSGDQVAAAQIMNREGGEPLLFEGDPIRRQRLEWRRATGVDPWTRLNWIGEEVAPNPGGREVGGATDYLIARDQELDNLNFRPFKFHGVSSSVVEVEGEATHAIEDPTGRRVLATYRQTWTRPTGRDWRVSRWEVGAFAPIAAH